MKQIEFNNKNYSVPEKWDEITIGKYISQHKLNEKNTDNDKKDSQRYAQLKLIELLVGIPMSELKSIKLNDKESMNKIKEILSILQFINEDQSYDELLEESNRFKFNGKTYYFVNDDVSDMEISDFLNMKHYEDVYGIDNPELIPHRIACIARLKKADGNLETTDDYDIDQRAKEFYTMPANLAKSIHVFFYAVKTELENRMRLTILQSLLASKRSEQLNNTMKRLAGQGFFMKLLIGVLSWLNKYTLKRLQNVSIFFQLDQQKEL